EGFDFDEKRVVLDDRTLDYDYLVVAFGQRTAELPGGDEGNGVLTLKSLEDAYAIREAVIEAAESSQGRVVIGGSGLSGIQAAGEIAQLFEEMGIGLGDYQIKIVEALDEIMPGESDELRSAVARILRSKG
ncbi:MAG: FAD-dependent oxidoreductase, partial [Halobacteria archaeon]|nr:FAD-dependent oxidoreductase [Halobacteria archaeon]